MFTYDVALNVHGLRKQEVAYLWINVSWFWTHLRTKKTAPSLWHITKTAWCVCWWFATAVAARYFNADFYSNVSAVCLYLCLAQVHYDYWILWPILQHIPAPCWPLHQLFHLSSCRDSSIHFQLAGTAIPSTTTVCHRYLTPWSGATVPHSTGASK